MFQEMSGLWRGLSHFFRGDLTKGSYNFSIVGLDERLSSTEELLRPLGGKHNQLESIGDFEKAIFYSNSCHEKSLSLRGVKPPLSESNCAFN
jgi:hypothetical protein